MRRHPMYDGPTECGEQFAKEIGMPVGVSALRDAKKLKELGDMLDKVNKEMEKLEWKS